MPHTQHTDQQHRTILLEIAQRAMLVRGLLPDFSAAALSELDGLQAFAGVNDKPASAPAGVRDLTGLLWVSIDNDDSRDQLAAVGFMGHIIRIYERENAMKASASGNGPATTRAPSRTW